VLHDVLEDTDVSEDELRDAFGAEVAEIVRWCSAEAKTGESAVDSWRARKQAYLDHLSRAPAAAVLVSLADKIHNARSLADDVRRTSEPSSYWERFNADRGDQLWYLRSLIRIYETRADEPGARITLEMVEELQLAVDAIT
jgi:(p)ppGpp synthase/HD superfamily hydrolase